MNWLNVKQLIRRGVLLALLLTFFSSCSNTTQDPVIIWTNRQEFASYVELFNVVQDEVQVIVIYKADPVIALPPAKDELPPDIVIGSWLRNDTTIKQFRPLNYLFTERRINPAVFYPQLLAYGNVQNKQYLLPVSFNLPAMIFATKNTKLVTENHLLTPDQIRDMAAAFNKKNKSQIHTAMGFAPSWSPEFLYTVAQLRGVNFRGINGTLAWSQEQLELTMDYFHHWTKTANDSVQEEQDFSFKYLYTPETRHVLAGSCLFAYLPSDELFSTPQNLLQEIGFRWIHQDNKIPVKDDMIFMGIFKKARNKEGAEAFLSWFMTETTQHQLLERSTLMNLNVNSFGIAGGFSALQSVTEQTFPLYYKTLLDNLPAAQYITPPTALLPRWESIKTRVIIPWLTQAVSADNINSISSLNQLLTTWSKQYH